MPPPPIPAIPRETTSIHSVDDAPHMAEPIKKTAVANSNDVLLPNASEIRPSTVLKG